MTAQLTTTSAGGSSRNASARDWKATVAITDQAGSVVMRLAYSAYGEAYKIGTSGVLAPLTATETELAVFTFQGHYADAETGLLYMGHRYYAPCQGRFITRDPLGYVDGLGLHEAFGGRPWRYRDPMGLYRPETDTAFELEIKRLQEERMAKFFTLIGKMRKNYQKFSESGRQQNFIGGEVDPTKKRMLEGYASDHFTEAFYSDALWKRSVPIDVRLVLRGMEYLLQAYTPANIGLTTIYSASWNSIIFGVYLKQDVFWSDKGADIERTVADLIHEPMHDLSQFGPGHGFNGPTGEVQSSDWGDMFTLKVHTMITVFLYSNPCPGYESRAEVNKGKKVENLWQQMLDESGLPF